GDSRPPSPGGGAAGRPRSRPRAGRSPAAASAPRGRSRGRPSTPSARARRRRARRSRTRCRRTTSSGRGRAAGSPDGRTGRVARGSSLGAVTVVAVVGLGAMGSRIARRLLDAGHEVVVWNRTAERAAPLVEAGATAAATPAEAARRAEVVVTMVADPAALRDVTEGPEGTAAGVGAEATAIEMSTVGPDAVRRLASILPAGTGLLDAPVLGSRGEAESGTLRIFVGGPAELAERWTPLLSTLGSPLHVGPLGSGAAAKLVANTTLVGTIGVLGEALALADGLGLSREKAFEVLAATPLAG